MSEIEERVIERIRERAAKGEKKYGTTKARTDLVTLDWIVHSQEELMDGIIYLERLRRDIEALGPVDDKPPCRVLRLLPPRHYPPDGLYD